MQRVLLMVTSRNGLTQRAELALRRAGRSVRTAVVTTDAEMDAATASVDYDIVICPYLTRRIPARIYSSGPPVVIVHPGPIHDRGPSSIDWALTDPEQTATSDGPRWGVTAIGAVDKMDAGPIWASRIVVIDTTESKSCLYNGVLADAAIEVICETADRALDCDFVPLDQGRAPRPVPNARTRRPMRQSDRAFDWGEEARTILRHIRSADGSPGVLATIAEQPFYLHDAHPGQPQSSGAAPGTIIGHREHAIEIACGVDDSIWIGHLRAKLHDEPTCKGPATSVLRRAGISLAQAPVNPNPTPTRDIAYWQEGQIATIRINTYNGTLTTAQCARLVDAINHASTRPISVLVLRGATGPFFCTGLHLGAIELASNPFGEGMANIRAINQVCRALLQCPHTVIAAITGNAAAGGAMLALCADIVAARERVMLNPHYRMGLTGSELHTLTLPRRVGTATATRLLVDGETLDTHTARDLGLIDHIGPNSNGEFDAWLSNLARSLSGPGILTRTTKAPHWDRATIDHFERHELAQMSLDLSSDAHARARRAFLLHQPEPARVS
ncbi:enoyl-CoA hydratase-related protein (plasmid) [Nocardia sp. NBC_01377]|uniref:enoyl-CoA hydratase-related protein n=1 Tax=Nocardia sp. NBC_01377 TaxID=2903595 RepID=UPI002F91B9F6